MLQNEGKRRVNRVLHKMYFGEGGIQKVSNPLKGPCFWLRKFCVLGKTIPKIMVANNDKNE